MNTTNGPVASGSSSHHRTLSSSTSAPTFPHAEQSTSKLTLDLGQSFELQELHTEAGLGKREQDALRTTIFTRVNRATAVKFPTAHGYISRAILYASGPKIKADLPNPRPILNVEGTIKGHHISFPLETTIQRLTRPLTRPWIFVLFVGAYIIGTAFLSREQSFLTPASSFVGCTATYWSSNAGCGLDGSECGPFDDDSTFDFRCPAQCETVILQNPRTVGNQEIAFRPLIVGGGDAQQTYRADSFICAAAIQAGVISKSKGGCGTLQQTGNFTNFLPWEANGLLSIGFPSIFPASFRFSGSNSIHHCTDLRTPALAFNVLITCLIFIVLRPGPLITFWSMVLIGYWHVALFSQPRSTPPPLEDMFATFLPACFVCYAIWRIAYRFTLPAFSAAPIEAAVLYLGPFWVGVLYNLTIDLIPISRLTSSDLTKRNGAITWFVIILLVVLVIVVNQVRVMRATGWLPYYAVVYISGGLVILVMSQLPGLELRLHHYILAIIFLPGTAFPTRLSAIYQGLLLALFLNGVAAFDFDSILQTAASLRQDAVMGSELPTLLTNSSTYNSSISLQEQSIVWSSPPDGWDGFALLVDDVERYIGRGLNFSLAAFQAGIPHFFRLALTSEGTPGDFTRAATLWPNGTWVNPDAGAT